MVILKLKYENIFSKMKSYFKKKINFYFFRNFIIFFRVKFYSPKLSIKYKNLINNKIILITGTNSGIGLELTKKLLKYNNTVIAFFNKNSNNLNKLKSKKLIKIKCDLSSLSNLDLIRNKIKKFNPEIIVNNAVYTNIIDNINLESVKEDKFFKNYYKSFNVNYFTILKLIFIYFNKIKNNKIKLIINVSSTEGIISNNKLNGSMMYKTTKSSINALTKCLYHSLAKYNVNVFALHPGSVKTKLNPQGFIDVKLCASKILELMTINNKFFNGKLIDINNNVLKF
jgi:short-subunit dehydrogenase involved in D-alanine esterification of teichoic acids